MKTLISTRGQIVLPVELRQLDGIEAGEEFDIERIDRGEYKLSRRTPPPNGGLVKWLLDCPEKGHVEVPRAPRPSDMLPTPWP